MTTSIGGCLNTSQSGERLAHTTIQMAAKRRKVECKELKETEVDTFVPVLHVQDCSLNYIRYDIPFFSAMPNIRFNSKLSEPGERQELMENAMICYRECLERGLDHADVYLRRYFMLKHLHPVEFTTAHAQALLDYAATIQFRWCFTAHELFDEYLYSVELNRYIETKQGWALCLKNNPLTARCFTRHECLLCEDAKVELLGIIRVSRAALHDNIGRLLDRLVHHTHVVRKSLPSTVPLECVRIVMEYTGAPAKIYTTPPLRGSDIFLW